MGFTSQDDIAYKITELGQSLHVDGLSKTTTPVHTAGGWHSLAGVGGFPNATTYPGTDLVFSSCWESTGDGTTVFGIQHGGVVAPATKHAFSIAGTLVAAAGAPWQAKLVDLQGYYRLSGANVTGTGARTLINSETFTANAGTDLITYAQDWKTLTKVRFTTTGTLPSGLALNTDYYLVRQSATTARVAASLADAIANTLIDLADAGTGTHTLTVQMRVPNGAGCEAFFAVQTAPTGGGPNLTASDYTNPLGVSTRAFQGSPTMGAAADAYASRILHSGNAAGRYGAFLPKQGADTGIARINSFTLSGGTAYTGAGVLALCIARPIFDITIPVTGMFSVVDLLNQLPSMPRIHDGACLVWLLFGTGATTNNSPFNPVLDVAWS